ncbi:hypothetical protein JCM9279_001866 [Rhodotorula babjevae]
MTERGVHYHLDFYASVLHMRGDNLTTQPLVRDGDVFLWNGEVFDGLEVSPHENDGQKLFDQIQHYGPSRFFAAIRDVEGPYAFVFYQASTERIYFARDPLGRRSLLFHLPTPDSPAFLLASTAPVGDSPPQDWTEVATDAVHCIDLRGGDPLSSLQSRTCFSSTARRPKSMRNESDDTLIYPYDPLVTTLPRFDDLTPPSPLDPTEPVVTPQLAQLVESFLIELKRAMRARVVTIPPFPAPPDARVAVLFSGGLDCTVLAVVLDRVLPEGEAIDLITVAFENPRKLKAQNGLGGKGKDKASPVEAQDEVPPLDPPVNSEIYDVPDRITARSSWQELKRLRPERRWNLVEVNVPYREMLEHRQKVIDLMKPQRTVMDLHDWAALLAELQLDVDRLPTRNLGRDDRVISSHGKEARYPYLAAHVVDFLAHVPVWLKADYRFREGVGEKMLLRLLAKRLGLVRAASLLKKAIHFGVNTAKMELAAGRSKGTDLLP